MFKKVSLCVVLCLAMLSLESVAQEKIPTIEHIYWAFTGYFNETTLTVPDFVTFQSLESLFEFHVPPSPKSDIIFFECGCQSSCTWFTDYPTQSYWSGFTIDIISPVIPDNYKVSTGITLDQRRDIVHTHPEGCRTEKSTYKIAIERDGFLKAHVFSPLSITNKLNPQEDVSNEIANAILNALMDKGFDAKVTVNGQAEGVQIYRLVSGWIHVTRTSK